MHESVLLDHYNFGLSSYWVCICSGCEIGHQDYRPVHSSTNPKIQAPWSLVVSARYLAMKIAFGMTPAQSD